MDREVMHLAIPAYPIALARVVDSGLRGRPVVIVPGSSERSLVQCVSPEAAGDGVVAGMSLRRARRHCPALLPLPPDPQLMARGNRALLTVVSDYSPLIEPHPTGRLFLDLTGCRKLLGPGRDVAMRLEREVEGRLRLTGTLGVAGNKLVSRIAAGMLDRPGVCDVLHGAERSFIAPLPVSVLPGIGEVREQALLRELNLRLVSELAALSLTHLRLVFGPFAPLVSQRANGIDHAPVRPPRRTAEIVEESFLEREENDEQILLGELCRLVEACGRQLRGTARGTAELFLAIHYADGVQRSGSRRLPVPENHDLLLYEAAEPLFRSLCARRTRVKGLKLACRQLGAPDRQVDLFTTAGPSPRQQALQQSLDQLRGKYGMAVVRRGRTLAA